MQWSPFTIFICNSVQSRKFYRFAIHLMWNLAHSCGLSFGTFPVEKFECTYCRNIASCVYCVVFQVIKYDWPSWIDDISLNRFWLLRGRSINFEFSGSSKHHNKSMNIANGISLHLCANMWIYLMISLKFFPTFSSLLDESIKRIQVMLGRERERETKVIINENFIYDHTSNDSVAVCNA